MNLTLIRSMTRSAVFQLENSAARHGTDKRQIHERTS